MPAVVEHPRVHAEPLTVSPGRWWPSIQPHLQVLAPTAAEAAGRALFEAWNPPAAANPGVLEQLALQAVGAAAAVANDPSVEGRYRASAVTDGCRSVVVFAASLEHAEERRERWWATAGKALAVVTSLALVAKVLQPREAR